ncbi:MAG TPA: pyridoxamine 5'-phosphate oxidase family protein [Anaerolineaceae bacterium]|nr:pyridoxamine 5'-phosphate oxidase family protein [Anaerolineaceae bacterium]
MRRLDRNIERMEDILSVLDHCKICRLAMVGKDNQPYVVPLNFGYEYKHNQLSLYMHCAKEGQKLDILKANPSVCFETDNGGGLISGPQACNYSQKYESVIAFGEAEIVANLEAKRHGLDCIMLHQTSEKGWDFDPQSTSRVEVIHVQVRSITGKRHM